jgi:hypothetical protein
MSTRHQQYSPENRLEIIRQYAAPQVEFSATMRKMRLRSLLLTHFLPTEVPCRESQLEYCPSQEFHPSAKGAALNGEDARNRRAWLATTDER